MKQLCILLLLLMINLPAWARTKLVALPQRGETFINCNFWGPTLIEEERLLTLSAGQNSIDFAWSGVKLDIDSILFRVLQSEESVSLISVSYPPGENALVWNIYSKTACQARVRISYLIKNIDFLATYTALVNKHETSMQFKSYNILRNFSGEDFLSSKLVDNENLIDISSLHGQTQKILKGKVQESILKKWVFDAAKLPWDPEELDENVGIPVQYQVENNFSPASGLAAGKIRVYLQNKQDDLIFMGEDMTPLVAPGETLKINIGQSRDIVVRQHKMISKRINIRRNNSGKIVLFDTDERITAKIENFKDTPVDLILIQHIPGQWDMDKTNIEYVREDASTLRYDVHLAAKEKKDFVMYYHRRNVRP